jgi:hypothetical protein
MTTYPWGKFYWGDYETDPALKLCSLAAQGLWMRCLCICSKADPKGYLVVAGRSLGATDLARLTGETETEIENLLNELALHGVFSRDRNGRIYSRRMVRDEKKSRTAQKNGKNGGNPKLCNRYGISPLDKGEVKGGVKPKNLDARGKTPEECTGGSHSVSNDTAQRAPDFESDYSPRSQSNGTNWRQKLFREGLANLQQLTGRTESQCRGIIGKWLKQANEDSKRVSRAIEDAMAEEPADPIPWITAALRVRQSTHLDDVRHWCRP